MVTGHVGRRSATKGWNEIVLDFGPDHATGKRDRRPPRLRRPGGDDRR